MVKSSADRIRELTDDIIDKEVLATLAGELLDMADVDRDVFFAFWKKLSESNKDELHSRIMDWAEQQE